MGRWICYGIVRMRRMMSIISGWLEGWLVGWLYLYKACAN